VAACSSSDVFVTGACHDVSKQPMCSRSYSAQRHRLPHSPFFQTSSTALVCCQSEQEVLLVGAGTSAWACGVTHACAVYCCVQWSPDDRMLASGGNDNALILWQVCGLCRVLSSPITLAAATAALALSSSQCSNNGRCVDASCAVRRCLYMIIS
jgi:hypothetical protein